MPYADMAAGKPLPVEGYVIRPTTGRLGTASTLNPAACLDMPSKTGKTIGTLLATFEAELKFFDDFVFSLEQLGERLIGPAAEQDTKGCPTPVFPGVHGLLFDRISHLSRLNSRLRDIVERLNTFA